MNNDDLLLLLMYVCPRYMKVRHERRSDREMSDIFWKNPMTDHCEKKDLTTPTRERYRQRDTRTRRIILPILFHLSTRLVHETTTIQRHGRIHRNRVGTDILRNGSQPRFVWSA